MSASKIEWTDNSDNVFVISNENGKHGWYCEKISKGCEFCYAEELNVKRFHGLGTGKTYQIKNRPDNYIFKKDIVDKWSNMRVPKIHFINSMTDTFLGIYSNEDIKYLFGGMRKAANQFFIILTKRPERALELERNGVVEWADNMMFMVTTENQETANERIPLLLQSTSKNKGISVEPMLGMIDLKIFLSNRINWVIVGGESGKNARPMHPSWVINLKEQCEQTGTAFFFKQWGKFAPVNEMLPISIGDLLKKYRQVGITVEGKKVDCWGHDAEYMIEDKHNKVKCNTIERKVYQEYPECITKHFEKFGVKKFSTSS